MQEPYSKTVLRDSRKQLLQHFSKMTSFHSVMFVGITILVYFKIVKRNKGN